MSHFDSAAHEIGPFINYLVLGCVLFVAVCVVNCLDICLDLSFNDAAHLIRNRIAVLALTVNDSRSCVQGIKNCFATVLAYSIPRDVEVRQCLIKLRDELSKAPRSLIAYEITPQVKLADHLTILQERTELLYMLISQVLVLRANHVRAVDSPRFERRLETVTYFRIPIKLHLNDCFSVVVLGCWLLLRFLLELGRPLLFGLLERLYLH